MFRSLLETRAPTATILVRLLVGAVFFSEGVLKFLYADEQGAGRFARIGIPLPHVMGPFVGSVEIICGALVVLGLLTRLASLLLLINISVAIVTTKIPILLGAGFWGFSLAKLPRYGFLAMLHEARTDFSMWLGSLFLIIVGAGAWSIDALIARSARRNRAA
ncbi:MAG: DoxX family protein [Phycisphaerae bacterium]